MASASCVCLIAAVEVVAWEMFTNVSSENNVLAPAHLGGLCTTELRHATTNRRIRPYIGQRGHQLRLHFVAVQANVPSSVQQRIRVQIYKQANASQLKP